LLQSVAVWSVALVAVPLLLHAVERSLGWDQIGGLRQPLAAAALLLAFSSLNGATGIVLAIHGRGTPLPMACPRELVVVGPYRYVRNPMAIAGIGQGLAIGLWFGSVLILCYAAAGALLWHLFVRPAEERDLSLRFGSAYSVYRESVPLWRPRWRPFVAQAHVTSRQLPNDHR
jgi:protein-S-isoprenylcysteine O-methyltransferase Ste14